MILPVNFLRTCQSSAREVGRGGVVGEIQPRGDGQWMKFSWGKKQWVKFS